jgi:hypothetical protein
MSSTATTLLVITRGIALLNAAILLAGNSEKYRALIAKAVSEDRDITEAELQQLSDDADDAIERLKP